MRKLDFETGYFYHVYNRGVEKRTIFNNEHDYYRFIYSLMEFNNYDGVPNVMRRVEKYKSHLYKYQGFKSGSGYSSRSLVGIIAFCLMPNHFHLILKQLVEKGISIFMHKLGTGYTKYFNQKYDRVGGLFQGTFEARYINADEYLMHLSRYIHLNPVGIMQPNWKENKIQNIKGVEKFLEKYKWSSYPDYIGKHNSISIANKEFLFEYFGADVAKYKDFVLEWLSDDMGKIEDVVIES